MLLTSRHLYAQQIVGTAVQAQNTVRVDSFVPFVNSLLHYEPRLLAKLQEYQHVLVDEV